MLEINWVRKKWYTSMPASLRDSNLCKADSKDQSERLGAVDS